MMDDARLIAWIDGELEPAEAEAVAAAVAADPALAARADTHRRLKARISAAFGPLLEEPVPIPERRPAPVVSLAAARAERQERAQSEMRARQPDRTPRRWAWPGAVAACLLAGILVVHQVGGGGVPLPGGQGIGDRAGALALAPQIADALDTQAAGQAGPVRVALSFKDKAGAYCRSFSAEHLGGVACRAGGGWQLRYATPAGATTQGDYRMAGGDAATMQVVQAMMAGDPLDAGQERKARDAGWK
jgi:anti-sigma factor RsiW